MKSLKYILFSLLIALSAGTVSTVALAEDDGRTVYAPTVAIDLVVGKIKVAIDAINSGSDGEKVASLIKDALDASKEINASDKVFAARSKENNKLKSARTHAKANSLQEAAEELKNAEKGFADLKNLL